MERLPHRQLLRIAAIVTDGVGQREAGRHRQVRERLDQVIEQVDRLRDLRKHLDLAVARDWKVAAAHLSQNLLQAMREVRCYIGSADEALGQVRPQTLLLRDLLEDLGQCQEEFELFQFTPSGPSLSVTTGPIELEDVYLGPFQIELDLSRLNEVRHNVAYQVIALEPHPAASNDSITHPHVSDHHLCEGDASVAIRSALSGGRLFDFFSLVRSVLTTYNASSPYISLSDWHGVSCHECGYTTDPDELHNCASCEEDYCSECSSYCRRCDDTTCRSCLEECSVCGELVCPSCLTQCPECGRRLCKACREDEKCPCIKERQTNDRQDESQSAQVTVGAETSLA